MLIFLKKLILNFIGKNMINIIEVNNSFSLIGIVTTMTNKAYVIKLNRKSNNIINIFH